MCRYRALPLILQRGGRESIAGLYRALFQPGGEPVLPLRRSAMSEGVRHDVALRLLLQPIVADGRSRLQRRLNVAGLDRLPALIGTVGPHTGETIGLQLDADLNAVGAGAAARCALLLLCLGQDAEQVLHVMTDLVCDHVSFGKLAGLAAAAVKAHAHLLEKRGVEIDALVEWTIERPHSRLRKSAAALFAAAIEAQRRRTILPPLGGKNPAPHIFGVDEHSGDELTGRILRRAGPPRRLSIGLLVLRRAAVDQLRAADKDARIDAERPANEAEYHDGTDAEAPPADGNTEAATADAIAVAIVFDVVTATKVIPAHSHALRHHVSQIMPSREAKSTQEIATH